MASTCSRSSSLDARWISSPTRRRLSSTDMSRLALLPQNPFTVACLKIMSPGGTCIASPLSELNDTSTPFSPSSALSSAVPHPLLESNAPLITEEQQARQELDRT